MLRLLLLALSLVLTPLSALAADTLSVTDLAGRTVKVPAKVERVILGEGRYVPVLAIFDREDPLKRVVGQFGEFQRLDPAGYAQYLSRFPKLAKVPLIGNASADTFSLEKAVSLSPQVAIFGLEGHGPSPSQGDVIAKLEAAGIAVIFIDFRQDPLVNTPRSIELLGKVLGQQKVAADFVGFYNEQMKRVTDRIAKAQKKPSVFIDNRVGLSEECCSTMVNGMMGRFVEWAGGTNLARDVVPGVHGTVSLEYLLTHQPDVYVGTAIGTAATATKSGHQIALGAHVTPEVARASLKRATSRPGISALKAVKEGRAFGVWHHFYNSPFNVAAVQAFAKWLHPDLFADVDPEATLRTLYSRFQPMELDGTYWIGLK
ncbi:ABC transporter substrate-binding protein [Archangium minus]|uniref:ABC transporter substrate-binding protein n=1 Tax=Archangium minus TaxID=83450 RepID=A0ABY9WWW6_9BACT|nr:ABC transporter substrate-binding protein [Archangium violaceum]WNG47640.1 ABC transporter substrate-binding protein [Archangium minus]